MLDDGTLLRCAYEGDETDWRAAIHLARFNQGWLEGKWASASDSAALEFGGRGLPSVLICAV